MPKQRHQRGKWVSKTKTAQLSACGNENNMVPALTRTFKLGVRLTWARLSWRGGLVWGETFLLSGGRTRGLGSGSWGKVCSCWGVGTGVGLLAGGLGHLLLALGVQV